MGPVQDFQRAARSITYEVSLTVNIMSQQIPDDAPEIFTNNKPLEELTVTKSFAIKVQTPSYYGALTTTVKRGSKKA